MAISLDNLLNIEPSKVSRDLTGYITYVYGEGGIGKTTLAKDMGALIIACEDGVRAMSGAYAQIVQSWSDIKTIVRLLKDQKLKDKYKAVAIDTIDIAAALCEKYICSQNGVDKLGQVPYGGGWTAFKKEIEETFRTLALQGYAVLFISHYKEKQFTRPDGFEFTKIVPTVSDSINLIIRDMSDIQAYGYQEPGTENRYMILRSDGSIQAKSRFPYMDSKIPFSYESLTAALNRAIDEEEKLNGKNAVTTERVERKEKEVLDYDKMVEEFNTIVNKLISSYKEEEFTTKISPKIIEITEKYLGKGKKVNQCSRDQVEQIELVLIELREFVEKQ